MRADMNKVIVERGRWNGGRKFGRRLQAARSNPESMPLREPVSRRHGTKALSENLAPLRRFLERQVGRPWDEVHSEICAQIAPSNAVQKHVIDHLQHLVARRVVLIEGHPHRPAASGSRRDRYLRLWWGRWERLYVCPESGLLRELPRRRGAQDWYTIHR